MHALMSEEDMEFVIETQIPLVEALDSKKRTLAQKFTTGGKKKVAEALAAIPKLPETSQADLAQFSAAALACMSHSTCSTEDSYVARSTSLLGCNFALLWHPDELQTGAGMQCMTHMHDENAKWETALQMPQLAAMWAVWIMCSGGTVVASTAMPGNPVSHASASAGSGGVSGRPSYLAMDTAGAQPAGQHLLDVSACNSFSGKRRKRMVLSAPNNCSVAVCGACPLPVRERTLDVHDFTLGMHQTRAVPDCLAISIPG